MGRSRYLCWGISFPLVEGAGPHPGPPLALESSTGRPRKPLNVQQFSEAWQQARERDATENGKGGDPRGWGGVTPIAEQVFVNFICCAPSIFSLVNKQYGKNNPVSKM